VSVLPDLLPELLSTSLAEVLAFPGLGTLAFAVALAGLVRGFTGFGTALVYLPIAGQVLDPVAALVVLILVDFVGPIPAIPRALRDGHPRDVLRLGAGALVGLPLGISVLLLLSPEFFRNTVSVLTLLLLAVLVSGLRYRGHVGRPAIYGIGVMGGFLGGAAGLPGPPVILLYMARPLPVEVIRANTLLYLVVNDVLMVGLFWWRGLLTHEPVLLGLAMIPLYLAAVSLGAWLFDPKYATLYRRIAYAIIAASALSGLPLWD
jgi:hypothetical protein